MYVCMYDYFFTRTVCIHVCIYLFSNFITKWLKSLLHGYMNLCMYACMYVQMYGLHLARVCLTVGESDRGSLGRIPECILHHPAAPSAAKRRPRPIVPGEADGLQQTAAFPRQFQRSGSSKAASRHGLCTVWNDVTCHIDIQSHNRTPHNEIA